MDIPILLYHRIAEIEKKTTLCVPKESFEKHLDYLLSNGYNIVSLNEIAAFKKGRLKPPSKPIAITFDDGFEDNYTNA